MNYKSEAQLQYECVKWFNNTHIIYRKCLVEINNNTNKGAYRKSLGQVKGASDLVFLDKSNAHVLFIELKLNGSTHSVAHLKNQLEWAKMMDQSFYSIFCFSLEMFQDAIDFTVLNRIDELVKMSYNTHNFLENKIINAEFKKVKSVKLDYQYGR